MRYWFVRTSSVMAFVLSYRLSFIQSVRLKCLSATPHQSTLLLFALQISLRSSVLKNKNLSYQSRLREDESKQQTVLIVQIAAMEGREGASIALDGLSRILSQPESSILPWLLSASKSPESDRTEPTQRAELLNACQFLFQEIEALNQVYTSVLKGGNDDIDDAVEQETNTLSGLRELFVGPSIDAESIWGQIELQNEALINLLRKSTKQLSKSQEDICVLGMNDIVSDGGSHDSNDGNLSSGTSQADIGEEGEEEYDDEEEEVDEDTRRIRMRMERVAENMESDEDSSMGDGSNAAERTSSREEVVSVEDPAAEELNDGFFDIKEMEDFADEEEDFLPSEAFGNPKSKKKTFAAQSKSFHQRQRDADLENDGSEDDDMVDEFEEEAFVRRKKYRESEDINALYSLYEEPDSDDDDDDVVNMTAADFFGKPSKTYYNKHQRKRASKKSLGESVGDAWGGEDGENTDEDDYLGWGDKGGDQAGGREDGGYEKSIDLEDFEKPNDETHDDSRHAKESARLLKQTKLLENELLAEKPWQMSGESKSTSRPVNSLLEATPEFQYATKVAPAITVEQTASLEEIIKQRVLSEEWDDVIPRELPDVGWHSGRGESPEVSQEKSKLGLGELYEREYLKKAVGYDKDSVEKQTAEDVAKNEMKQLFANLCSKLDALSNYQFAPRPVADEADVRPVTTPAIAMEEVLPLHVSDARGVAPEEVYASKRGRESVLRSETELDQVSYMP